MTARLATLGIYVALLLATVVMVVVSRVRPAALPRLGQVVTWAMRRRTTQVGLLLAWWWLGWHFVTLR
ncbi:DUF6186 family protein [Monashia sp. NPDC004114]